MIFSTFEVFRGIADSHPEEIVANAFVALGNYHLEGIPDTPIKPDIERAREMYTYAASYFGDPDAQYRLGRMFLNVGQKEQPRPGCPQLQHVSNRVSSPVCAPSSHHN